MTLCFIAVDALSLLCCFYMRQHDSIAVFFVAV